jgi:hypothetical protein
MVIVSSPWVEEAIADQVQRPLLRRIRRQFEFNPVVARQSLILSNAEAIQILRIELPDDGTDIESGVILGTGEGPGLRGP